ncbi:damage-inducible protein DinB [Hahella sp. CCB-MM4]|uniref:DinB family protein n=1 Tax=Hahella sp. (strain CCB-MM4) TaxID=1926491 RepID=UPI000B9BBFB0|nr:DinB family protein [Hahella sp. CCB-MM4]OZG72840.1 damage-inducible protein DinB [Hahella sp. CCB-MM4]
MLVDNYRLMAKYNQWMNRKIYDAASTLSRDVLWMDNGAFFKSILGTLNHIMVGDLLWLNRYRNHPRKYPVLNHLDNFPTPNSLDQILETEIAELGARRSRLDQIIIEWCGDLEEEDLDFTLHYGDSSGQPMAREFGLLIQHFFNHQTHHRGQITTLLSQHGINPGETDLLMLIPRLDN